MARKKYDVALSFAGEDRAYVEEIASDLAKRNLRVFYDKFEEADIAGRNLVDHLSNVYQNEARLVVIFISASYVEKAFPRLERQSAQATALYTDNVYILPVRIDATILPGMPPTTAFVSGKTPQALAQLIAMKLMLQEAPGFRTDADHSYRGKTVLIRFVSFYDFDAMTFSESLGQFRHRSSLSDVPVEFRAPPLFDEAILQAKDFRTSTEWLSRRIGEEARAQFAKLYDACLPQWRTNTVNGVKTLIAEYGLANVARLAQVVRQYVAVRMIAIYRVLSSFRLVGMPPFPWEDLFCDLAPHYNENVVMAGLAYVAFLDGDERFLWADADAYTCSGMGVGKRRKVYVPSTMYAKNSGKLVISPDEFDRFFAVQFLQGSASTDFPRLSYLQRNPDDISLVSRGEWVWECRHFDQHGTSNFGGEPLFESVRALRASIVDVAGSDEAAIRRAESRLLRMSRMFLRAETLTGLLVRGDDGS